MGFCPQKHGRKRQMGGIVIFHLCEINLCLSKLQGECVNSNAAQCEEAFQVVTKVTMLTTHWAAHYRDQIH